MGVPAECSSKYSCEQYGDRAPEKRTPGKDNGVQTVGRRVEVQERPARSSTSTDDRPRVENERTGIRKRETEIRTPRGEPHSLTSKSGDFQMTLRDRSIQKRERPGGWK